MVRPVSVGIDCRKESPSPRRRQHGAGGDGTGPRSVIDSYIRSWIVRWAKKGGLGVPPVGKPISGRRGAEEMARRWLNGRAQALPMQMQCQNARTPGQRQVRQGQGKNLTARPQPKLARRPPARRGLVFCTWSGLFLRGSHPSLGGDPGIQAGSSGGWKWVSCSAGAWMGWLGLAPSLAHQFHRILESRPPV